MGELIRHDETHASGVHDRQAGWDLTIEERNELVSGALSTKGEGDSRESVNSIQAQEDIVVLQNVVRRGTELGGNLLT
jgi:hypothetical protein